MCEIEQAVNMAEEQEKRCPIKLACFVILETICFHGLSGIEQLRCTHRSPA